MTKPLLSDSEPPESGDNKGGICSVGKTLVALDDESAKVLAKWLEQMELYNSTALSSHLFSKGITLSPTTLRRHRRGECRCPR